MEVVDKKYTKFLLGCIFFLKLRKQGGKKKIKDVFFVIRNSLYFFPFEK
jgi:hypothetical protein